MTNQKTLAIGLWVVFLPLLAYQFFSDDSAPTNVSPIIQESLSGSEGTLSHVSSPIALSKTFENPRQKVKLSKPQNVFRPFYLQAPTAKPKGSPRKAPPPVLRSSPPPSRPPPPSGPSPEELATQRARQQLTKYRFLGYLTQRGESQAFLTNGQAIYIVKQGENVEGNIRVNKIDPTTLVLSTEVRETGNLVEASIPLTEEQQNSPLPQR